jgi:hypothetical protein
MAIEGIANEGICCMAICPINTESWKGRRRIAGDLALRGNLVIAGIDGPDRRNIAVLVSNPAVPVNDRLDFDFLWDIAAKLLLAIALSVESAPAPRAIEADTQVVQSVRCALVSHTGFCNQFMIC